MSHIFLGAYIFAILGVAQAGALEIHNTLPVSLSRNDGQPITLTSTPNSGPCGTFAATSAGTAYSGNAYGYADGLPYAFWDHTLWGSNNPGGITSTWVGASKNGDHQKNAVSFAILNGKTNRDGTFGHVPNLNDTHAENVGYGCPLFRTDPDSVAMAPEPQTYVPEPQSLAMLLAGLGLLGLGALRRRSNPFD